MPLVAWRLYARFRRLVGRQRASRVRPWITLTVFPMIVAFLAFASRADAWALALFAAALAAGAALGRYGLAKTQFEATRQGLFYTPHAPLGIALLALFAGRILYRVVELARLPPGTAPALGSAPHPLTLAIFGLLAGYYMSYAVGIVLWRRAVLRRAAARRGEA
ncbi:MAG TPA: hypothetical protein VFV74_00455 [Burkholderiales bacterium]|nr:hypothetical protein [Burkholderiales bacterium]